MQQQIGDQQGVASSLNNLGGVACKQGDYGAARGFHEESLTKYQQIGDQQGIAECFQSMSAMAEAQDHPQRTVLLLGASDKVREILGAPVPLNGRDELEERLSAARAALGGDAFAEAFAEGRAMTLEQAVEFALSDQN